MTWRKRPEGGDPRRGRGQDRRGPDAPDSDYLLDAARENWPHILLLYRQFKDKRPVMLLDLQSGRIYAYPYLEFKEELSERSQRSLEEQYEQAGRECKIVVFVRDNEQRRLVSFSMDDE
jgi:hypothetical protein